MTYLINGEQFKSESGVASNDLVIASGDLVTKTAGFVTKTAAGEEIVGVAHTSKTFDSDNETVALDKVVYAAKDTGDIVRLEIVANAAITQANEGQTFDIDANQDVDVATAGSGTQLRMTEYVSDEKSIYEVL